jgi:hypothetical protein
MMPYIIDARLSMLNNISNGEEGLIIPLPVSILINLN